MACSFPFFACEPDNDERGRSLGVFTAPGVPPALADDSPIRFVEADGTDGGRLVPSDIELIYEEVRLQDASGRELSREARGTLTLEIWQRTSHQQFYLDASEPYLYHEEDGTQRHTYRIRRQPNRSLAAKPLSQPGPPRVDSLVFDRWAEAAEDEPLSLMVRLAELPEFQPPPLPPKGLFPESEEVRALELREAYLQNHASRFTSAAAGFQADVEAAGGRLLEVFPNTGWVSLALPQAAMAALVAHPGINHISLLNQPSEDCRCSAPNLLACNNSPSRWMLGEGRNHARLDADKFLNVGIDGRRSNSNRHQNLRLFAGIVESGITENESLALSTLDPNFGTRLFIYDCASSPCDFPWPQDYPDDFEQTIGGVLNWVEASNGTHGTMVSSILAADFRLGQADGNMFGDPTYATSLSDPSHCSGWENASTGMAPGAAVIFANAAPSNSAAYIRAYGVMQEENVDVLNCSHSFGIDCNISSSASTEDELENAYDDGITIVAGSGNIVGDGTNCSLASPADTPKVLAVASLDATPLACQLDYQDCLIDDAESANGGMNATINGTNYSRIIAGVDLVAPQRIVNVTHAFDRTQGNGPWPQTGGDLRWPEGWNNDCDNQILSSGSSAATPHVSGLALLLKHWQLNLGNTLFNYPGRMQALLLAMADRWDPDFASPRLTGVSYRSGFGRIKLRYLSNANFEPAALKTLAIPINTSTPNITNWVWPSKMPAGTNFMKCVLFEPEDMSIKSDISDIYLRVNLKNPDANGSCSESSTMFRYRYDNSRDIRHMVAHETDVAGKCVEYQIIRRHVTASGSTVHLFCYYSSRYDYEDVAD